MVWWSDLRGKEQSPEAKWQTAECSDVGVWGQGVGMDAGDMCGRIQEQSWLLVWESHSREPMADWGRGMEMGKNTTPIYVLSLAAQSDMQLGCPLLSEALEEVTHSLEDTETETVEAEAGLLSKSG